MWGEDPRSLDQHRPVLSCLRGHPGVEGRTSRPDSISSPTACFQNILPLLVMMGPILGGRGGTGTETFLISIQKLTTAGVSVWFLEEAWATGPKEESQWWAGTHRLVKWIPPQVTNLTQD